MSGKSKSKKKPIKLETSTKSTNSVNNKGESHKQPTISKQSNAEKTAAVTKDLLTEETSQQFVRDDVLVISENPVSKYSKRQISSNWTKYEVPIDNYEQYEDKSAFGANYEELLQMPISSGYFQFKHEKSWSGNDKSKIVDDLFTLDPKSLFDGISCIPFYERNRLDPSLFDKDHIDRMNKAAESNRKQYENNLPVISQENELAMKMINLLSDKKPESKEPILEKSIEKEQSSRSSPQATKITATGSAIEDIMLNLDIDQWLEEHLEE